QEVLKRYGYLQCGSRRRRNRHRGGGGRDHEESSGGPRSCSAHELRKAVRLYQRNYNMPETGQLDQATLQVMSESRCGNPDIEAGALPQRSAKARRRKREPNLISCVCYTRMQCKQQKENSKVGDSLSSRATLKRRRRWLQDYVHRIETGQADRRACLTHNLVQSRRRSKRSVSKVRRDESAWAAAVVLWRLFNGKSRFIINDDNCEMASWQDFWDTEGVILIEWLDAGAIGNSAVYVAAFRKLWEHMNCQNNFDGFGGQLSHVIRMAETAEIHVDDDEQLTVASEQGTNLVKVAVHEAGHALGLYHTPRNYSIMYAIYSRAIPNSNFELGPEDRRMAQEIYGTYKLQVRFDTAFDWVRQRPDGHFIYNTYFFRGPRYWMYENRYNRTRYGDPLPIVPEWKGIPTNLDAFAHVWSHAHDATYFFKGKLALASV
ncbi:unnamed protein product, partial [Ixodes hexagonus]